MIFILTFLLSEVLLHSNAAVFCKNKENTFVKKGRIVKDKEISLLLNY